MREARLPRTTTTSSTDPDHDDDHYDDDYDYEWSTRNDDGQTRCCWQWWWWYVPIWSLHQLLQITWQSFLFPHEHVNDDDDDDDNDDGGDNVIWRVCFYVLRALCLMLLFWWPFQQLLRVLRLGLYDCSCYYPWLFGMALVLRNVLRAVRAPFLWDSEYWLALTDAALTGHLVLPRLLLLAKKPSSSRSNLFQWRACQQTVRYQLALCYAAAALFKLNTSFLHVSTSCAPLFTLSLWIDGLGMPSGLLIDEENKHNNNNNNNIMLMAQITQFLAYASPWLTILAESWIAVWLWMDHVGAIPSALVFHAAIALTPFPNGVPTFSCVAATRLAILAWNNNIFTTTTTGKQNDQDNEDTAKRPTNSNNKNKNKNKNKNNTRPLSSSSSSSPGLATATGGPTVTTGFGSAIMAAVAHGLWRDASISLYFALAVFCLCGVFASRAKDWTPSSSKATPRALSSSARLSKGDHQTSATTTMVMRAHRSLSNLLLGLTAVYAFAGPIVGLQEIGSNTMFANMRLHGGSNHLLRIPTGLLQKWFYQPSFQTEQEQASVSANAAAAAEQGNCKRYNSLQTLLNDWFGGGVVRVESTTSEHLLRLYPGDITTWLSPSLRQTLQHASIGHFARQFNPKARRVLGQQRRQGMPWPNSQKCDKNSSSINANDDDFVRYTVPALELRRLLEEARAHARRTGQTFDLVYTRLEGPEGDEAWRRESLGGRTVEVRGDDGRGGGSCRMITRPHGAATLNKNLDNDADTNNSVDWVDCTSSELAMRDSQGLYWPLKVMLFYPYAILPPPDDGKDHPVELLCNY